MCLEKRHLAGILGSEVAVVVVVGTSGYRHHCYHCYGHSGDSESNHWYRLVVEEGPAVALGSYAVASVVGTGSDSGSGSGSGSDSGSDFDSAGSRLQRD